MTQAEHNPDPRYLGLHAGVVIDNVDPDGLGRVRVEVPGLLPEDGGAWALPFGPAGGGAPQRGLWDVPDIGADVYLHFLGGDPDKPRYTPGSWGFRDGVREVPTPVATAFEESGAEGATQVKVWETRRFLIVMDDREGRERLYLMDKNRGEDTEAGSATMIELDGANGGVIISGTTAVLIRSLGLVDIQALKVQINGRDVLPLDKAI